MNKRQKKHKSLEAQQEHIGKEAMVYVCPYTSLYRNT